MCFVFWRAMVIKALLSKVMTIFFCRSDGAVPAAAGYDEIDVGRGWWWRWWEYKFMITVVMEVMY